MRRDKTGRFVKRRPASVPKVQQAPPPRQMKTWRAWAILLAFAAVTWFLNFPVRWAPWIAGFILFWMWLYQRNPELVVCVIYGFVCGIFGSRPRRW